MSISSARHDAFIGNVAKVVTIAVIALGMALIVAMFVYTV